MSERDLREQLQQLSAELDALPVSAEKRRTIEQLIADIEKQLGEEETDDSLLARVEMAVSSFEAEHPRVAGVLNNIMVTLGNIGV